MRWYFFVSYFFGSAFPVNVAPFISIQYRPLTLHRRS
jgi:hypothetical protein